MRARFDAHLQTCDGCRRYLHQMHTAVRIAGTLTEERLDPAARDELLLLFRN
jgi:predicted anti-sigma-YlaC factor YlaD